MITALIRPPFADENPPLDDDDVDILPSTSLALTTTRSSLLSPEDGAWNGDALLQPAESCVIRFAAVEADLTRPDLVGLARHSATRLPRLGGVLHGRVAPGSRAALALTTGVARTIRAGYQAALATQQVAARPIAYDSVDELWDAFVPASYRVPRSVAAITWDMCRFDEFWEGLLLELGLDREAHRIRQGYRSPLQRSIRGLSTVGVALAVTERGVHHERLAAGRRADRHPRRALPPAPRQQQPIGG